MPAFAYRAATADGAALHGVEQAATAAALERALAARGLDVDADALFADLLGQAL